MIPYKSMYMQEPSYLGKITLVSIWHQEGIDPNIYLDIQGFSHLVIPHQLLNN